jgi:hypothetical protein
VVRCALKEVCCWRLEKKGVFEVKVWSFEEDDEEASFYRQLWPSDLEAPLLSRSGKGGYRTIAEVVFR